MAGKLIESAYYSGYGTSAASGTITFYNVGTLTPAVVYGDDSLSTPLSQPITLDARGATPTAVYTATPLRAVVKSAAGATLADIARIDGDRAELVAVANSNWTGADLNTVLSALAASTGGTDGQFKDNQAGAVARPIFTKFAEVQRSVKDFGAIGNGIADDTTAIQATINVIAAGGGGTVFFPPGTYLTSAALSITAASVNLLGVGTASQIKLNNATANAITLNVTTGSVATNTIANLAIGHSSTSTGAAISAAGNVSNVIIDRVFTGGVFRKCFTSTSGSATVTIIKDSVLAGIFADGASICLDLQGTCPYFIYGTQLSVAGLAGISSATACRIYVNDVEITALSSNANGISVTGTLGQLKVAGSFVSGAGSGVGLNIGANFGIVNTDASDLSSVADARTVSPQTTTLAGNGSVTPAPNEYPVTRIIQSGAAAATTLNAPSSNPPMGRSHVVIFSNTSGGALTLTTNAIYSTSAAIAPTNGNRTLVIFVWDALSAKYYEASRATVAN